MAHSLAVSLTQSETKDLIEVHAYILHEKEKDDHQKEDGDQREDDDQEEEDETAQLRIGVLLSISDEIVDSLSEEHDENQILNVIEDLNLRFGWKQHDQCRVRFESNGKWCDAQIADIVIDEMTNNEWLTVKYEEQKAKINRFSTKVMPTGMDKEYQCNEVIIEYILNEMGISYDQYNGNDALSLVTDYFYDSNASFLCLYFVYISK